MKNIYKILTLLLFIGFSACDSTDELYKELDSKDTGFVLDIVYTLEGEDYENAIPEDNGDNIGNFKNFSSEDDVKTYIPVILSTNFPGAGANSSAKVTYDFFRGSNSEIGQYTGANNYTVSTADYTTISAEAGIDGFFNNTSKSGDFIPTILAANVTSPADGDLSAVTYEYAEFEYVDVNYKKFIDEDFESYVIGTDDLNAFTVVDTEGSEGWYLYSSSSGYQAARVGGFANGMNNANMDRLILPQVDLTGFTGTKFKLNHVVNFLGTGVLGTDVAVMVSTDYDGVNAATATWTNLVLDKWPVGDSYDRFDSEASLAAYDNQKIYISFYYKSTTVYAPQWRVIDIQVVNGVPYETIRKKDFYSYSSSSTSWSSVGNAAYYLSSAEYDAMGAPGTFNNFSSSSPANNYLPAFLLTTFPFAQEDDTQVVIYDYFSSSSGAGRRGDHYTFNSGKWNQYQSTVQNTFTFGNDGKIWQPDNTIKYTLNSDDYAAIAAATAASNDTGSGSMASFGNYDISLWTSAQIFSSITVRLEAIFPTVEGQKYLVTYATWEPGAGSGTIHVIWNGSAYVLVE
jgi:hypothetical protein